jgi:hypothetical protein
MYIRWEDTHFGGEVPITALFSASLRNFGSVSTFMEKGMVKREEPHESFFVSRKKPEKWNLNRKRKRV